VVGLRTCIDLAAKLTPLHKQQQQIKNSSFSGPKLGAITQKTIKDWLHIKKTKKNKKPKKTPISALSRSYQQI